MKVSHRAQHKEDLDHKTSDGLLYVLRKKITGWELKDVLESSKEMEATPKKKLNVVHKASKKSSKTRKLKPNYDNDDLDLDMAA